MKKCLAKIGIALAIALCLSTLVACDLNSLIPPEFLQELESLDDGIQNMEGENGTGSFDAYIDLALDPKTNTYRVVGYNKDGGTLVYIPSEYNGLPVTTIGSKAFMGTNISVVTIPDSVTVIEDSAFKNCSNLELVTIGNNGSMLERIDKQAFFGCDSLVKFVFVGNEDVWNNIEKGNDWDKHVGVNTANKTYVVQFFDVTDQTETESETESETASETVGETNVEIEVFELELPVFGFVSLRCDPTLQVWSSTLSEYWVHLGVDIQSYDGAPVVAAANGTIYKIWDDPLMGKCVAIDHGDGIITFYKNLDPDLPNEIVENAEVECGQHIGNVGFSAWVECADLAHLHFEMTIDNIVVDPEDYFSDEARRILASVSEEDLKSDSYESNSYESDSYESNSYESDSYESNSYESDSYESNSYESVAIE